VSEQVENLRPGDGYRFEGVKAKDDLVVLWSLNGTPCPPIRVDFANCASPPARETLQVHWSHELAAECPALQSVVYEMDRAFGTEAVLPASLPFVSAVPVLVMALVLAAALLMWRRGARRRVPVALAVCLAIVAAELCYRAFVWSTRADAAHDDAFVLYAAGESTLVGEPFEERLSLPGLVSEMLAGHIRNRRIEIVSVAERGAGAYAQSLRLAGAVAYRNRTVPGAVLIYTGHNEPYLGAGTSGPTPLVERILELRFGAAGKMAERSWLLRDTLLYVRSLRVLRPRAGMHPYERSLRRLIQTARDSGLIPVLFTLPSNISGVEPNAYAQDTDGIAAILAQGASRERAGDVEAALDFYRAHYRAAVSDRPAFAPLLLYRIAHCQAALGRHDEARRDFWAVVDQDPRLNFGRTTAAQNALIRRLAAEYSVPLVDGVAAFERDAAHGIPGNDLFADGHHPNLRGYWLLASACAQRLAEKTGAALSGSLPTAESVAVRFALGSPQLGRAHVGAGTWLIATSAHHPWPVDRMALAEQHFRAAIGAGDELSAWLGVALSQAARNGGFLRSSDNLDLLARSTVFYTNQLSVGARDRADLLARLRDAGVDDAVVRRLQELWSG
jgi:hypothetical protein